MAFLLDTDVISQATKPLPIDAVIQWLRENDQSSMYLSVATLLETKLGADLLPIGKRRATLQKWIEEALPQRFGERILPVTAAVALDAGTLMAAAHHAGYTADPVDALIAATARVHGLSVVTLNRKHFARLQVPLIAPGQTAV